MGPLELSGESVLYLSFAGSVVLLIAFVFRPSAYSATAFCACLVTAALMYITHARPQIARPPMSEEAAIYHKQLEERSLEKDWLERRMGDVERELSKARLDQVRLAEALAAFEASFPASFLDASPLHIRVKRAGEETQALKAKLEHDQLKWNRARDSRGVANMIQGQGWSGGQPTWHEPIPLICVSV